MKVLVTGASGFVGQKICQRLITDGFEVVAAIRSNSQKTIFPPTVETKKIDTINSCTDWSNALYDVDVVMHLAARVHVMKETASDPLKEYLITNADGTQNLALQAQKSGVKKFIFLSTIGVNGDSSGNKSFTEFDNPAPHNAYSVSKKVAEEKLIIIAKSRAMEIVIIRAPLVYGKGNRGNFLNLVRAVKKGIPLPLNNLKNRKNFIYVGNLVDALVTCINHPKARGIYLVSDNEEISTPELIRKVSSKIEHPVRLFSFPTSLIKFAAFITGNSLNFERLANSLTVDSSKIRYELDWTPPYTMEKGLEETSQD